jgi:class 3 adenylate cyclase
VPESLQSQLNKVRLSIKVLEAQRLTLGEEVIEPALAALEKQAAVLEEQLSIQAAPVEERRMVTILFIDMVGSTAIAESLDPEEWRSVVSKLHGDLSKAIIAHNGAVAQYLGDGLLAFFGSRQASEHDPENAIRAALDIQAFADSQVLSEKI